MSPLQKGIILAVVHLAIVCSLGAKLLYDRATRPRVWARTMSYDPNLPIRGRYASMLLQVNLVLRDTGRPGEAEFQYQSYRRVRLTVEKGVLTAIPDDQGWLTVSASTRGPNQGEVLLTKPVLFFIPEHALDPTRRQRGEELWAEVTVPKKGPPRPIQLAVKKGESFTPLNLR